MQYCIFDLDIKRIFIGEGVGYVHGQKALPGERIGRHFENSIWARMSESGIIGIWLFIFPILIVLKNFKIRSSIDVLTLSVMLGYLFVSYVSPNGEHQTSQMSLYLVFGLYLYRKFNQNKNVRIWTYPIKCMMKTCIDYYSLILSRAHNSTGVLGHTSNPELFLGLYILSTYLYFS